MRGWPGIACGLAVWLAAAAGASAPTAKAGGAYVALGDSVAASSGSYVEILFDFLRSPEGGGLETRYWVARGGEDSTTLRTSGQLSEAIADIGQPSDTKVVTIDIGGNDRSVCGGVAPSWHLPSCPFAGNFEAALTDLQAALASDPGSEWLIAMTYYNPAAGTGTVQEQGYDRGLLGTDLMLGCAPAGDPRLGLNDQIACISSARGALVADVYPAFKLGGPALISSDGLHPSSQGQAAIAAVFQKALGQPPPPPPADTTAPALRLSGATVQRVLRRRGVRVLVSCPAEACTATAKGRVVVRGAAHKYRLGPATEQLARGGKATLKLKLRRRALAAIRRVLMQGRKVRARLIVEAADTAGNVATNRRTIRLIRSHPRRRSGRTARTPL